MHLPSRGVIGAQRRVAEDVGEGQEAAVAFGLELEREALAAPRPDEEPWLLDSEVSPASPMLSNSAPASGRHSTGTTNHSASPPVR